MRYKMGNIIVCSRCIRGPAEVGDIVEVIADIPRKEGIIKKGTQGKVAHKNYNRSGWMEFEIENCKIPFIAKTIEIKKIQI